MGRNLIQSQLHYSQGWALCKVTTDSDFLFIVCCSSMIIKGDPFALSVLWLREVSVASGLSGNYMVIVPLLRARSHVEASANIMIMDTRLNRQAQ